MKELSNKQQDAIKRIFRKSLKQQQSDISENNRRTSERMMNWNKQNLSPSGGKKAFVKIQNEPPKPKQHRRWLTKNDEE